MSPDLDLWIEKYCRDADVFVLVTNAESTLNNSEKKFFHRVNDYISRPNIFILNNRWDGSALEPDDIDAVRSQHTERGVNFLVNELKCATKNDAQKRIFFTSAREALFSRITKSSRSCDSLSSCSSFDANYLSNVIQQFGYEERLSEFKNFENTFQITLSQSAIVTKFKKRSDRALQIIKNIIEYLNLFNDYIDDLKARTIEKLQLIKINKDEQVYIRRSAYETIERKIQEIENDIFKSICTNFSSETSQLDKIIKSFNYPFQDNEYWLEHYKTDLVSHVETGLEKIIIQRCNSDILKMTNDVQNNILEFLEKANYNKIEYSNNLEIIKKQFVMNLNFPMYITTLSQEFNPDITFRFSISPSAILKLALSLYNPKVSDSLFPSSLYKKKNENRVNMSVKSTTIENGVDIKEKTIKDQVSINENGKLMSLNGNEDLSVNPAMIHAIGLMTSTTSGLLLISLGIV